MFVNQAIAISRFRGKASAWEPIEKSNWAEKVISAYRGRFTLLCTKMDNFVNRVYMRKNSPCFPGRPKLARIVLDPGISREGLSAAVQGAGGTEQETSVGRYRKIG